MKQINENLSSQIEQSGKEATFKIDEEIADVYKRQSRNSFTIVLLG